MTHAQEWLDKNYPSKDRNQIIKLDLSNKDLEGSLTFEIKDFSQLEELDCSNNLINKITFTNSVIKTRSSSKRPKLEWKLKKLNLANNNFAEQDLGFLAELTNLEELSLDTNQKPRIYNCFKGSLEPLQNMTKLKTLDISATDIDSGLEYLPASLEIINCSVEKRPDAKVKTVEEVLEKEKQKLFEAVEKDDLEKFKELIKKSFFNIKPIVNNPDEHGSVLLHHAISKNNLEVAEVLIEIGAKVNVEGEKKLTPLHLIARLEQNDEQIDLAQKLLEKGTNPNAPSKTGGTPLHFAAEGNNVKLLKLLAKHGGNINATNKYGWSILHSAASGIINKREDWKIIKWLLQQENLIKEAKTIMGLTIESVFLQKDWSYMKIYNDLVAKQQQKQILSATVRQG